jgi:hypothetical protein
LRDSDAHLDPHPGFRQRDTNPHSHRYGNKNPNLDSVAYGDSDFDGLYYWDTNLNCLVDADQNSIVYGHSNRQPDGDFSRHRHDHPNRDVDGHRDSVFHPDINADINSFVHGDSDTHAHFDFVSHKHAYSDAFANGYRDANSDRQRDRLGIAYGHAFRDLDSLAYGHTFSDFDDNPNSDSYFDPFASFDRDAHIVLYGHADRFSISYGNKNFYNHSHGHFHPDFDSYRYADLESHGYANG